MLLGLFHQTIERDIRDITHDKCLLNVPDTGIHQFSKESICELCIVQGINWGIGGYEPLPHIDTLVLTKLCTFLTKNIVNTAIILIADAEKVLFRVGVMDMTLNLMQVNFDADKHILSDVGITCKFEYEMLKVHNNEYNIGMSITMNTADGVISKCTTHFYAEFNPNYYNSSKCQVKNAMDMLNAVVKLSFTVFSQCLGWVLRTSVCYIGVNPCYIMQYLYDKVSSLSILKLFSSRINTNTAVSGLRKAYRDVCCC